MITYVYKNVITNYTKTYGGIEIGPEGVQFNSLNPILDKYVPSQIERTILEEPQKDFLDTKVLKGQ